MTSLEYFSNHKCWATQTFCRNFLQVLQPLTCDTTQFDTWPPFQEFQPAPQWRYVRWCHQWPKQVDPQEMEIDLEVIAAKYTLEAQKNQSTNDPKWPFDPVVGGHQQPLKRSRFIVPNKVTAWITRHRNTPEPLPGFAFWVGLPKMSLFFLFFFMFFHPKRT